MDNIKVSIVIPVYNEEKYLRRCLNSVINQTYKNLEIICVDDGSTDNSVEIINNIRQKDNRIYLIRQENQYAGVARNKGFSNISGQYVIFLDSDDFFAPTLIEKMLNKIIDTDADFVMCEALGLDEVTGEVYEMPEIGKNNIEFPNKDIFSALDDPNHIFQLNVNWAWDKLYNVEFLKKNQICFQNTKVVNDLVFVCVAYATAKKIAVVSEKLICHRTNVSTSLYFSGAKNWECLFIALSTLKKELEKRSVFTLLEQSFINLVAENLVYYSIVRFPDNNTFNEFYDYYKEHKDTYYNFENYPSTYYRDEFVYSILFRLNKQDKGDFLIGLIKSLNQLNGTYTGIINSKHWLIPDSLIPRGARIIIYGIDDIGKDYYKQIASSDRYQLVMIVDPNFERYIGRNINVCSIQKIKEVSFDVILVTYRDRMISNRIKNELINMGIIPKKIMVMCSCLEANWMNICN